MFNLEKHVILYSGVLDQNIFSNPNQYDLMKNIEKTIYKVITKMIALKKKK